ncbi:IS66 family transposase [Lachnospiraceae bacterium YH-ros2228]
MGTSAADLKNRELRDTIKQLNATIASLNSLIKTLQTTISEQNTREQNYKEQIDYLTKKLFAHSSEKNVGDIPGQMSLFNEAEMIHELPPEDEVVPVKGHTRKKRSDHSELFKGIPVEKVVVPLPEDQKTCPACGTQMEKVGEEFQRRELQYIPAKVKVIEYYSENYVCPNCKKSLGDAEKPVFVKSHVPEALIQKSYASASTVAWAMYQKYANSVPLYRQEKDWQQYGVALKRSTLANWIIQCSRTYFSPVYDYMHRRLIQRRYVMADETRMQVLKEDGRRAQTQSFLWCFRSGDDGLPPIILFHYSPTRNGDVAKEFLDGFNGYLETDGYQGYNKVPEIKRCTCFAHLRRYFIDAIPKGKQFDYSQPAVQGVEYCNRLFRLERVINSTCNGDYDKRKELRLEKEKPVLDAFWKWLDLQKPVRGSRFEKAVNYAQNRRETSMTYLEDGHCSLSNNNTELVIRACTVGRKNWLFSDTVGGAEASATVYSIVESAKANGLNVYQYLIFLLDHRPCDGMTDDALEQLMPWSINAIRAGLPDTH